MMVDIHAGYYLVVTYLDGSNLTGGREPRGLPCTVCACFHAASLCAGSFRALNAPPNSLLFRGNFLGGRSQSSRVESGARASLLCRRRTAQANRQNFLRLLGPPAHRRAGRHSERSEAAGQPGRAIAVGRVRNIPLTFCSFVART